MEINITVEQLLILELEIQIALTFVVNTIIILIENSKCLYENERYLKFTLTDCNPLFGINVHTDATYDYRDTETTAGTTTYAPTNTQSGVCLDFTHVPCNQL